MASILPIGLGTLPDDCLIAIFSKSESPATLGRLQQVCRRFYAIGQSSFVWKLLYAQYFPEHQPLMKDLQKVQALFLKGVVITDDAGRIDYRALFQQSTLKSRVKKSFLFFSLTTIPVEYSEGDYFQGSNKVLLEKMKKEIKRLLGQLKGMSLLQEELFLRAKVERIWWLTLKSCFHQDDTQHGSLRVYNFPNLLRMMFDFFESGYHFMPEENLDYWIVNKGLALLEDAPNAEAFLLKAYFLYCVIQSKDLTSFAEAVERNFRLIEPNELSNSLTADNKIFRAYKRLQSDEYSYERFERDFVVHDVILRQFLGLKGFISGLCFSQLCQCKGINPNLFLSGEERLPIIHIFLSRASALCAPGADINMEFERRCLADDFSQENPEGIVALFEKYGFTIGGRLESQEELVSDFDTLLRIRALNISARDEEDRTAIKFVRMLLLPEDLKEKFIAMLEVSQQMDRENFRKKLYPHQTP